MIKKIEYKREVESEIESHWQIHCGDDTLFEAEFLIWGDEYKKYQELVDKNIIDKNILQFIGTTANVYSLYITYYFDKAVTSMMETMFIPLSHTHDQGHFIGEFKNSFNEKGKYRADFLHFISGDDSSEEEIAKRVRGLRKNLEKIFGNSFKPLVENIQLSSISPSIVIDDNIFNSSKASLNKFYFLGENAPISQNFQDRYSNFLLGKKISHITRGLIGLEQIKQGINYG